MNIKVASEQEKELKIRREYLANALNNIKHDYSSKNHGDSLTILGPIIEALATASSAQVLRSGSPSLLMSLRIALQGIESENSEAGVIGKVLSAVIKGVNDLVIESYLAKEDVGSKQFFQLIAQAFVLITVSVAWKLEQFDVKKEPSTLEEQKKEIFGFELILLLILRTRIIPLIVKNIVATCGANGSQQDSIAKFMKALALFLILLTAAKGNSGTLKILVLDLKDYLIEGLEDIQSFLDKTAEAAKANDKIASVGIFLQQALASLYDEDFDTLQLAYAGALEMIQATPKLMDEDIERITKFAEVINKAFTQGPLDLNQTTASLMI